jgi:pimeloyl-ACP methyl ester carboxylesterase
MLAQSRYLLQIHPAMPLCQYKNLNLHYTDSGKGRAVVLLHGFLENLSMWNDFATELSKRNRVFCMDLLGHGQSDCYGYTHTMEDMAHGVKAVLNQLKVRRCIIIGHSMGGYVALAFADLFPDNVRGLGLFYSTAKEDAEERKEMRLRAMDVAKTHTETYLKTSVQNLFYVDSLSKFPADVDAVLTEAKKMNVQGIVAALAGMRERPNREALLHFGPYKVLVINGRRDGLIPIESMEEQMKAARVTHTLITENGHMGHIEDRDACLKMLKEFIAAV